MFWRKKFRQIEVDPDPKDIFDPTKELLAIKNEIIDHLKEENQILKEKVIELQELLSTPKVIREMQSPVHRFVPFSEVRKRLEEDSKLRAEKRKNEKVSST